MTDRRFCWAFLVIIMAALFHSGMASAQKIRIGPSIQVNPSFTLPFYAAQEENFWGKNGVEAEWVALRSAAAMFQAMAAEALDMGLAGPLGAVLAIANGVPITMVADLQSPGDYHIWVLSGSRIKEPMDLKGAKIGITRFGGTVHAYGVVAAKALGLQKDIKWTAAGGAREEMAALKAGVNNGIVFSYYAMAKLEFEGEVRKVVRIHDYLPKEWMEMVLLARRELVRKNPDLVKRTTKALFEAAAFAMRNPDWTSQKLKEHYGYPEDAARQISRNVLRYGREPQISRKVVENIRSFLVEYGIIPKEKVPPLEELYTSMFLR